MAARRTSSLVLAGALASAGAFAVEPAPAANAAAGRALYTGEIPFEKGGAPCGACHALGGEGIALSATFGPDLSSSQAAHDPDILDGVLTDQPYKSMRPIYAEKPISAVERANLAAFFQQSGGGYVAVVSCWFGAQAAVLAAIFGALLVWGRRRPVPSRVRLRRSARRIPGGQR